MCGLAGFWIEGGAERGRLESSIAAMIEVLHHRGPDDAGFHCEPESGLALGHRRLSIIDLSTAGHQPMASPDGRHVLVFNGEIYNYRELRAELVEAGYAFRSSTDTEVMLAALVSWGVERALERFVGMFAFAFWDARERVLVLARDRLGIKPLYWGSQAGTFFFASELKALRRLPEFRPELDRDAVALFFRHNYVPAPHSVYRDVHKLEPGCYVQVRQGAEPEVRRYWDLRELARRGAAEPLAIGPDEALDELERRLGEAVEQRLVSDVPLGAFLSGGIDSSVVVAQMQQRSKSRVRTFTIGFHEQGFDEAAYARRVAEHLGTEHHELYVTPAEARDVIPSLPEHWDEPFSDSSQIPTFLVSRFAREEVTVCLSGDGGDELFGGYPRYYLARRLDRCLRFVPALGRKAAGRALGALVAAGRDGVSGAVGDLLPLGAQRGWFRNRAGRLAEVLGTMEKGALYRSLVSHWKKPDELVLAAREPATLLADPRLEDEFPDSLQRMMFVDSVTYLPDDILCKVDRASMAVSLEARVPLLDHRVVEFVWRLPQHIRVGAAPGKRLLRRLLGRSVPRELFERPKMGFGIPISQWLRDPLRGWCEELLDERRLRDQGVLEPGPIRRRWEEHRSGRYDWSYYLWDVLVFQGWYARWMV